MLTADSPAPRHAFAAEARDEAQPRPEPEPRMRAAAKIPPGSGSRGSNVDAPGCNTSGRAGTGMHGDLAGIIGGALPAIKAMELPAVEVDEVEIAT